MPSGTPGKIAATCHPEREHTARGLCAACYQREWLDEHPEIKAAKYTRRPPATCHPNKPALAKGLCGACYRKTWRAANPEKDQENGRRSSAAAYRRDPWKYRLRSQAQRYGLTVKELLDLHDAQGGRCAACNALPTRLHVDHCHESGKVRGLLCFNCNSALGHAKDDRKRLRRLIRYLERHQREEEPGQAS